MPPRPPAKFGGAPTCSACGKQCYATEQVKHNDRIFHEACFCCKLCSFRIVPGQATEHQGQLYHKTCLPKILKPPHLATPVNASPSAQKASPEARSPSSRVESPSRGHPPSRPPPSPPGLEMRRELAKVDALHVNTATTTTTSTATITTPLSTHSNNNSHNSSINNSSVHSGPRSPAMRALEFGLARVEDNTATKALQNKLTETEALLEKERARCRELEAVRVVPPTPAPNTAQLDALKAENTKLSSALEDATQKLKQAQLAAEKLKQENSTLLSFHSKLEREHSALQQVTDRLQSTLKDKTTDLNAQLANKEEKIATLSKDLQQRNTQFSNLTAENQGLLGDLKLFEAEITSLTEKNHELQHQLAAAMSSASSSSSRMEPESPPLQPAFSNDSQLLHELARGRLFTSYRIDPQHPHSRPTSEKVLVFYEPGPEGHKGWICWSSSGRRQIDPENRIAVNPFTQLSAKNTRDAFSGSNSSPNRCFSVLGADEDNVLDLEAESEGLAKRWQEGLQLLLKKSIDEIITALDEPPDFETLEQKQRMEELHKIEMELIHEVERLKVRKQALMDAEPAELDEDSDTY